MEPLTLDEVRKAVRELKHGKTVGKHGIPTELLKVGNDRLNEKMYQVIEMIREKKKCFEAIKLMGFGSMASYVLKKTHDCLLFSL